jgi:galactokinase/mevalonate kinase-like predicted kinase
MNQFSETPTEIQIKKIPYRMAFAGGWIDQPYISKLLPHPPGSMVVVSLEPNIDFLDRCGMGTSTRKIALDIWGNEIPHGDRFELMRQLYMAENKDKEAPSGSQDMAGIIYPGINRLDYDYSHEGGIYPVHIETEIDPGISQWLEDVIHIVPINQRPEGYDPLGEKNLDPDWIQRLGQTGKDCYNAILSKDITALGQSMNECMLCWHHILPNTVKHSTINIDLMEILRSFQSDYAGAMYSGCGGGYLYIVSDKPVQNSFKIKIRLD